MKDNNLVPLLPLSILIMFATFQRKCKLCEGVMQKMRLRVCIEKEIPKVFFLFSFGVNRALELYTMSFIKFYDAASFFFARYYRRN